MVEKRTVKNFLTIRVRDKYIYGDTKLGEEKTDSGGNNEFCTDKGIEYEWQEDITHFYSN